ncbi:hypothetical protein C7M84_004734 [Penaeus vannamei]|uniref:Uncharacterized protein n=1 Tax=Penaeus vannamei TaxID=6689 RepID=A0A3R7QEY7_PENVA|nr:hypothetical protein C7M84_004734 [Penaeus vannamei]
MFLPSSLLFPLPIAPFFFSRSLSFFHLFPNISISFSSFFSSFPWSFYFIPFFSFFSSIFVFHFLFFLFFSHSSFYFIPVLSLFFSLFYFIPFLSSLPIPVSSSFFLSSIPPILLFHPCPFSSLFLSSLIRSLQFHHLFLLSPNSNIFDIPVSFLLLYPFISSSFFLLSFIPEISLLQSFQSHPFPSLLFSPILSQTLPSSFFYQILPIPFSLLLLPSRPLPFFLLFLQYNPLHFSLLFSRSFHLIPFPKSSLSHPFLSYFFPISSPSFLIFPPILPSPFPYFPLIPSLSPLFSQNIFNSPIFFSIYPPFFYIIPSALFPSFPKSFHSPIFLLYLFPLPSSSPPLFILSQRPLSSHQSFYSPFFFSIYPPPLYFIPAPSFLLSQILLFSHFSSLFTPPPYFIFPSALFPSFPKSFYSLSIFSFYLSPPSILPFFYSISPPPLFYPAPSFLPFSSFRVSPSRRDIGGKPSLFYPSFPPASIPHIFSPSISSHLPSSIFIPSLLSPFLPSRLLCLPSFHLIPFYSVFALPYSPLWTSAFLLYPFPSRRY